MNVNETIETFDEPEINNTKSPSNTSSDSPEKEVVDLEESPVKNNVVTQLTGDQCGTESEKHQEKSILEKFLTRPLSTTSLQDSSRYSNMDNRKVEPLKINLHREPIKTVIKIPPATASEPQQHSPKITIKPLKPPPTVASTENTTDAHTEPHIVPKLTIRNISHTTPTSVLSSSSSSSNECSVVPKLTIKLDHQNSQEFNTKVDFHQSTKTHEKKHKTEEGMLTADGVKLTIKPIPEPPIPKLTIKTTQSDTTTNNSEPSIPKLFIKPIQKDSSEVEMQSGSEENDSNENSVDASVENMPIPKLTLKKSSTSSDMIPTVPKLILKMGGNKIVCRDDVSQNPFPSDTSEGNDNLVDSEKNSPEHATSDSNLLANESDQSAIEHSPESIMKNSEKFNASTAIVRENPDSPRIILKINKTSSNEVKSVSETSSHKDFNVDNIVSSTISSEPEIDTLVGTTDKDSDGLSKAMKRAQADLDSDVEFSDEEPAKKAKLSAYKMENDNDITTVDDKSPKSCTVISDEDTNDLDYKMEMDGQKDESMNDISKQEIDPVCITIDDDSCSMDKKPTNEEKPDVDLNQTSVAIYEESSDVTPVKRGRGRPKKILQALNTKQFAKETETDEKEDETKAENSAEQKTDTPLKTPSRGRGRGRGRGGKTMEIVKGGKVLQVKMDAGYEDDDSPTFSIYNRYATTRGRGRGGRGKRGMGKIRKSISNEGSANTSESMKTPTSSGELKVTLQKLSSKTPGSLQIFEEDTLMGGDLFQSPFRNLPDFPDESQSSQLSSASATNEGRERKRGKMEVCEPEGRTEFTVDMLAEYEWPPKHGQKHRSTESYMIQEQISEYLGIKSFKRKYPDLVRRPVEMEERNYMMERGLVSEKMCDLGLTAVIASEILDIMCNDYPEKYEEYRRYQREKQFLELSHRQKLLRFEQENRGQLQKDKAIETAASWNTMFNKERIQTRKSCIDLQTLVIQIPKAKSEKITARNTIAVDKTSYPIALVPGQFSEFFKSYTPEELACYPVNTVLIHHAKLNALLKEHEDNVSDESDESENESDDETSSSDSDSSDSSTDEENNEDPLCAVCDLTQYKNSYGHPEIFIECTACCRKAHPTCIKMPLKMVKRAMEYSWKCAECKNCSKCLRTTDESKMLFCGQCDRGFHIYCLGLRNVPEGQWYCNICTICTKCGTKSPEGNPNPLLTPNQRQNLAMVANWTHLYRTNNITKLREHHKTLCVPCAKLKNVQN